MEELGPGSTVGRYVLTRLIGEGGMGMVWAARHSVTNKHVALKMLKPAQASDPHLRERFVREARASCAVHHPNIVDVHDVMEVDGRAIMVMDLLEGESLGQKLDREGLLALDEFARILLQVVSGVGTAHASGVVHRDLKPDNIFLAKESDGAVTVKVLDFGIAKVLATEEGAQTGNLTGTGAMLGTPYYMAPEQIFGERDIDHRADIWALGVIFYECLSGTRPTRADNIGQILKIISTHAIKPLDQLVPTLPKDLTDLVDRMLSQDREQRPQSLMEVKAALARYADLAVRSFAEPVRTSRKSLPGPLSDSGERVLVRSGENVSPLAATEQRRPVAPPEDLATLSPSTAATGSAAQSAPQLPAPRARRGWMLAGAGAAVLLGAGIFAVRGSGDKAKAPAVATTSAAPSIVAVATTVPAPPVTPAATTTTSASTRPPSSATSRPPATSHSTKVAPARASASASSSAALPGGVVEKPPF